MAPRGGAAAPSFRSDPELAALAQAKAHGYDGISLRTLPDCASFHARRFADALALGEASTRSLPNGERAESICAMYAVRIGIARLHAAGSAIDPRATIVAATGPAAVSVSRRGTWRRSGTTNERSGISPDSCIMQGPCSVQRTRQRIVQKACPDPAGGHNEQISMSLAPAQLAVQTANFVSSRALHVAVAERNRRLLGTDSPEARARSEQFDQAVRDELHRLFFDIDETD